MQNEGKIISIIVSILIAFVLVFILNPFVIIGAGERGVVMNFGKVQPYVLDEGFHLRMPILQKIKKMTVRVQKNDVKADAASKDLQTITMDVVVNWHISPSQVNIIYQRVGDHQDILDRIITPATNEVAKASSAKKTAEGIIAQRPELKKDIDVLLAERLKSYGIVLDDVSLVNISFSGNFDRAVEEKQIAEQSAKKAQYIADQAIKEAEAEVNRAEGKAKAQDLLQQTLTAELLQKMWIDKWDGSVPQVVSENNSLLFQIPQ